MRGSKRRAPLPAAREEARTQQRRSAQTLQKKLSPVDTAGVSVGAKERASQAVRGKDVNSEAKGEKARGPGFSTTSGPRRGLVLFGFYGQ